MMSGDEIAQTLRKMFEKTEFIDAREDWDGDVYTRQTVLDEFEGEEE